MAPLLSELSQLEVEALDIRVNVPTSTSLETLTTAQGEVDNVAVLICNDTSPVNGAKCCCSSILCCCCCAE